MSMQLASKSQLFSAAVRDSISQLSSVLPRSLCLSGIITLDFSIDNPDLKTIEINDSAALASYVSQQLKANGAHVGAGGYAEQRVWYQRSPLFDSPDGPRTTHLGVDLWVEEGTAIYAPLAGKIHSFRDNAQFGDYGPTIVLEHQLNGIVFYSLYGHLSRASLIGKSIAQPLESGEQFAWIGSCEQNGSWPPHLHFQVILDMLENFGDFPGVAAESKRDYYLNLCPDPNPLLLPTLHP